LSSWTSAVLAPAVVAAVVSVAASGIAGVLRRREERRTWLRDARHEKYAALIDSGRRLAEVMRWTGPYQHHPEPLARAYDTWFVAASAAQLLAGPKLQQAIQKGKFAATRYHETRKPFAYFHGWVNEVESAARAELGLPEYMGWKRLSDSIEEVIRQVDAEEEIPPQGSAPHWTRSPRPPEQPSETPPH
jgi:hypothetical protein